METSPAPAPYDPATKQKSQAKTSRIPIKVVPAAPAEVLKKPSSTVQLRCDGVSLDLQ